MTLWRATRTNDPWFGYGSFWASRRGHAESYRSRSGFGGPNLYTAHISPSCLLDLRQDPWSTITTEFGLERDEYDEHDIFPDHELFADLKHVFSAHGYDWLVFILSGDDGSDEEWIYLGQQPIAAQCSYSAA